jgi:hypothetical protein
MFRSLPIGLLALGMLLPGSSVLARSTPPELKKLYIVLAFDTDSNLTPSLAVDRQRVLQVLESSIPAARCEIKELNGRDLTRQAVLDQIRDPKWNVGPDTGLLFFYGGHGVIEEERGHLLMLSNGPPLPRSELRKAMEARKPGLAVLLTDCCSTHQEKRPKGTGARIKELGKATTISPLFRTLFFQSRGTVDITAATDNASWGDDANGGVFTRVVCRLFLDTSPKQRDGEPLTWKLFFGKLQGETERTFKLWKAQVEKGGDEVNAATQKPAAFFLPADSALPRLKTYAVISLENLTDANLRIEYRWPGQTEWTPAPLPAGGKLPVFTELEKVPAEAVEMEIRFEGRDGTATLSSRIWKGSRQPCFSDGEPATIGRRK